MIEEGIYIDLQNKHKEIYNDLLDNINTIHLVHGSFKRKYRGDLHNDVSIIFNDNSDGLMARIFLKNSRGYINHTMIINNKKLVTLNMINKVYEDN